MITANHKHYETLVQNLEQMSNLTEDDFKNSAIGIMPEQLCMMRNLQLRSWMPIRIA